MVGTRGTSQRIMHDVIKPHSHATMRVVTVERPYLTRHPLYVHA